MLAVEAAEKRAKHPRGWSKSNRANAGLADVVVEPLRMRHLPHLRKCTAFADIRDFTHVWNIPCTHLLPHIRDTILRVQKRKVRNTDKTRENTAPEEPVGRRSTTGVAGSSSATRGGI